MYRILLPIDEDDRRAEKAVEMVVGLPCAEREVEVIILNVFDKIDASDDTGRVDSRELFERVDPPETVSLVSDRLDAAGIQNELRHELGDPTETILETVTDVDADAIVMAGQRRSPAGKLLFGSVAQSVLLHADVPVTVLTTA